MYNFEKKKDNNTISEFKLFIKLDSHNPESKSLGEIKFVFRSIIDIRQNGCGGVLFPTGCS